MSQSPVDESSKKNVATYQQGWRALNRLLHEDRSFSGHERNCAFLNTGGTTASFADVSAVTGFDFADDGRGLASADWDFDGDLDVWITNRTAPRVRFLRNNTPSKPFVAFKLQGDGKTSNRDAIGARLELVLTGTGTGAKRRIRTLHAGEGFLSQSSNWIHFGIGDFDGIEKLVVKWPGAAPEEFTGIKPGQFCRIVQGANAPQLFSPPVKRAELDAAEQLVTSIAEATRTIVPAGLPFPQIDVVEAGRVVRHELDNSRPTIVNVWSSTCGICMSELTEWSEQKKELLAIGVDIITLSTDHLFDEGASIDTGSALTKTGSTFTNKAVSVNSLQALDALQQAALDRWTPLPVPSTFLVSADGELVAFYKGEVSSRQLIRDIPLTRASPEVRRGAAVAFPGKWVGEATPADPRRVASILLDHDRIDPAIRYLEYCTALIEPQANDDGSRRNLGDLYYMVGLLNGTRPKRSDQAIAQLMRARDLIPSDLRIRVELGKQLMTLGKLREALLEFNAASRIAPANKGLRQDIALLNFRLGDFAAAKEVFSALVAADPRNAFAQYHLANTEVRLNNPTAAIAGYRLALTAAPSLLEAANNLAWILACHPDENVRVAKEAVALAQRLCALTKNKDPRFLDSLSVALANAGDFGGAIGAAENALALYRNKGANPLQVKSRLELYRAGTPYRETQWK